MVFHLTITFFKDLTDEDSTSVLTLNALIHHNSACRIHSTTDTLRDDLLSRLLRDGHLRRLLEGVTDGAGHAEERRVTGVQAGGERALGKLGRHELLQLERDGLVLLGEEVAHLEAVVPGLEAGLVLEGLEGLREQGVDGLGGKRGLDVTVEDLGPVEGRDEAILSPEK